MSAPSSPTNPLSPTQKTPLLFDFSEATLNAKKTSSSPKGMSTKSTISSATEPAAPRTEPAGVYIADDEKGSSLFPFKPRNVTINGAQYELSIKEPQNGRRRINFGHWKDSETLDKDNSVPQERYLALYQGKKHHVGVHLLFAKDHLSIVSLTHTQNIDESNYQPFIYLIDLALRISQEKGFKSQVYVYFGPISETMNFFSLLGAESIDKIDSHTHSLETVVHTRMLLTRALFIKNKDFKIQTV